MFFLLLLLLLVFLGLLQRGRRFLPFRSKKEKEEKSFFFRVSRPLFSRPLPAPLKETKKKRALFFLLLSDANKQTNANASLRLKSTTGGRVQKDDARLKKVLFLFCCVVLCSCFWSGCCFVSRGEREKGTTKKAKKEKILSRSKKVGFPHRKNSLLLLSVPKTRAAKRTKGVTKYSGSCRKLLSLIIIGQFKFQLAS